MDERSIENLIYSYAQGMDTGDLERVASLFRRGCICTPQGDRFEGREAVLRLYRASTRLYQDGTPRTRHITSNVRIEVDGDQARADSYFTVMQALPDFPLQAIICGSYADRFLRESGLWYFKERLIRPDLLGDLSRHLLFDPADLDPGGADS
jgi:uncharacterized protein (TIGR02246 family)